MDYNWLLKIDWQLIISVITLFIVILTFIITYFRGSYSVKLSIKEIRLPIIEEIPFIPLKLRVHFNNKGRMPIIGRAYNVEFDGIELVKLQVKWMIIHPNDIKLQPGKQTPISFSYVIEDKKITDINYWKKICSGKKIRFIFVEDNSGKPFKSKKVKFDNLLKEK